MKHFLLLCLVNIATNLIGQNNPPVLADIAKTFHIKTIIWLADKKETASEMVKREIKKNETLKTVYELETWQPNNTVAKTIVADIASKSDSSFNASLHLYYPIDSATYGEFILDTFKTNKPDFRIENIFTADFDNDSIFDIGLIYSYALFDKCNSRIFRTVYYKKPNYLGVYWEFVSPVFVRMKDERFDCIQSNCQDSFYCKFDNEKSIRAALINRN